MSDAIAQEVAEYLRFRIGNYEYYNSLRNIEYALEALKDLGYTVVKTAKPNDPPFWPKAWNIPFPKDHSHYRYCQSFNDDDN